MTEDTKGTEPDPGQPEVKSRKSIVLTDAQKKARSRRNWMIAGALLAFVVLIFLVTIVRYQSNIEKRNKGETGLNETEIYSVYV